MFPEFQFAVLTLTNDNDRQQSKTQWINDAS